LKILKKGNVSLLLMNTKIDLYLIDAGNSFIKLGVYKKGEVISLSYFVDSSSLKQQLDPNVPIAISSVLNSDFEQDLKEYENPIFWINHSVKLPFKIKYLSPATLGIDRICNVAAIVNTNRFTNRLIIDVGTCIKFDFLNDKNEYEGGSISPGLKLRYKALNLFTDKLPLIDTSDKVNLIGNSTESSIQSGVQNGIESEINGLISKYREKYKDLSIYITGGDAHYFDLVQKNGIFADEILTLKGILEIYLLNV
jgi:type III pantothenate kinase